LQVKVERHVARPAGTCILCRGNSDFDIRHTASVGAVYNIPGARGNGWLKATTSGRELSDNYPFHTGAPVIDLFASQTFIAYRPER
jgi:hypothetical protein